MYHVQSDFASLVFLPNVSHQPFIDFCGMYGVLGVETCKLSTGDAVKFWIPYQEDLDFDHEKFLMDLTSLSGIIQKGEIRFTGENSAILREERFRYLFMPESKEWKRENAEWVFPSDAKLKLTHSERMEFFGLFADVFEDFLDEKGVEIPNPEKEDDDNAAILYGTDYDQIVSGIEGILISYGVLEKEGSDKE